MYIQPSPWWRKIPSLEKYACLFQRHKEVWSALSTLSPDQLLRDLCPDASSVWQGLWFFCTSLVKYLGFQGLLSAALCFSSPRCRSSRRCLCSVASSMFPSFRDLVTCFHSLLESNKRKHVKIIPPRSALQHLLTDHEGPPGFCPPLSLHRPQLLLGDGKFVRVDDFGFSAAVGELQSAVPLALSFAHDGVGGVVFDLRCHSVVRERC